METTNAALTICTTELDIANDMPDIPLTPPPTEFEMSDYESDFSFGNSWALDEQ